MCQTFNKFSEPWSLTVSATSQLEAHVLYMRGIESRAAFGVLIEV